jgi:hypothetical protein
MEQDAFPGEFFLLCGLNPVAWWFWKSRHRGKRVLRGERGLHGGRTDSENSRCGLRKRLPVNLSGARPVYGTKRFPLGLESTGMVVQEKQPLRKKSSQRMTRIAWRTN